MLAAPFHGAPKNRFQTGPPRCHTAANAFPAFAAVSYSVCGATKSSTRQSARWKVYQQRVYIDPLDGSGFQDLEVTATRNSNGYLILRSDGRECSMCN